MSCLNQRGEQTRASILGFTGRGYCVQECGQEQGGTGFDSWDWRCGRDERQPAVETVPIAPETLTADDVTGGFGRWRGA